MRRCGQGEESPRNLCDFCGGELRPQRVSLDIWQDGELILCEDVPADVCTQCGEKYLHAKVAQQVECFLAEHRQVKPLRYVPVPVYRPVLVPA
jgi:YgiT-type zinc finger domain-containing protein